MTLFVSVSKKEDREAGGRREIKRRTKMQSQTERDSGQTVRRGEEREKKRKISRD